MRIFVGSLIIFFGTLLVAALLALGNPGGMGMPLLQVDRAAPGYQQPYGAHARHQAGSEWSRWLLALGLR